jgi:hypothetical protein
MKYICFIVSCFFIYSYVYTLLGPSFPNPCPLPPASYTSPHTTLASGQFCWRENKKDIAFLLASDKDSYTER